MIRFLISLLLGGGLGLAAGFLWLAADADPSKPDPSSGVENAIEERPLPPIPEGSIALDGEVRDASGAPIDGVEISYTPRRVWADALASEDPSRRSPAELTRAFARRARWAEVARRTVRTDAEGSFRLEGLPAGRGRLRAHKAGWSFEGLALRHALRLPEAAASPLHLQGLRRRSLPLRFARRDGHVPEQVELLVEDAGIEDGPRWRRVWTPENGALALSPGRFRLSSPEGIGLRFDPVHLEVPQEGALEAVSISVRSLVTVAGRLDRPAWMAGLEDLHVGAWRSLSEEAPPGTRPPDHGRRLGGDDGWSFRGLEAGVWSFAAYNGRLEAWGPVVQRELGAEAGEIILPPPPPGQGEILSLRIVDPEGRAVTRCAFRIVEGRSGRRLGPAVDAWPGREPGEFVLPLLGTARRPPGGTATLVLKTRDHGRQEWRFEPAKSRELAIRLRAPGVLEVALEGRGPEVEARHELCLRRLDGERPFDANPIWSRPLDKKDARWRFDALVPGRYAVELACTYEASNGKRLRFRVAVGERQVAGGAEETVRLPWPALGRLRLRVGAEAAGRWVVLRHVGPPEPALGLLRARVFRDGFATFGLLPDGDYHVGVQGVAERMPLTVRGATERDFVPRKATGLALRLTDPEGPLATEGLKSGDRLLSIDGWRPEPSPRDDDGVLARLWRVDRVRLVLERDGEELDFELHGRRLRAAVERAGGPGGELLPVYD